MIAIDTETTGLDFPHGSRPFVVTTCDERGDMKYWEWEVDPLTRMPMIPPEDIEEVRSLIVDSTDDLILHNAKFDVRAIQTIVPGLKWPWERTYDTILAAHLLDSASLRNLTDLALTWLDVDIEPWEKTLEEAVKSGRRMVQQAKLRLKRAVSKREGRLPLARMDELDIEAGATLFGEDDPLVKWRIGDGEDPMNPSASKEEWRTDYWLPRALAEHLNYPEDHEWWTVLRDYANQDSPATLALWVRQRAEIERRNLWGNYDEFRRRILAPATSMENRGLAVSEVRLSAMKTKYTKSSIEYGETCMGVARELGYPDLKLPQGVSPNDSLRGFFYEAMKLPVIVSPKTRNPTLDKTAMEVYLENSVEGSPQERFLTAWAAKKKRDKYLTDMRSYERFRVDSPHPDFFTVHPRLNPTRTVTLRWSSDNPSEQTISKRGLFEGDVETLRYLFGPFPGREWWSMDAKNIELRLPAYESGERALIDLFERPDDPPFYGSEHLLNFSVVYPEVWEDAVAKVGLAKAGPYCKKTYESTYYKRVKNGGFALGYGAIDKADGTGTADRAFGRPGSQARLASRFASKEKLNQHWIGFANRHGYVETIPLLGRARGYPISCRRDERGGIKPTLPLNYHIQSSAMEWTDRAMVRVYEFFETLNAGATFARRTWPGGYHIAIQQHDELVLDTPSRAIPGRPGHTYNWPVIAHARKLMEKGGEDVGIPTPVGVEYHAENWSEGVTL